MSIAIVQDRQRSLNEYHKLEHHDIHKKSLTDMSIRNNKVIASWYIAQQLVHRLNYMSRAQCYHEVATQVHIDTAVAKACLPDKASILLRPQRCLLLTSGLAGKC